MKHFVAILLALVCVLSFTGCQQKEDSRTVPKAEQSADSTPDTSEQEETPAPAPSPLRTDTAYYSLTVPESWENEWDYKISEDTNALRIRHKASYDAGLGGHLFSINLIAEGEDYSFYPSYELLGNLQTENGTFHVVITYPTDVQFTEETADAYNKMCEAIPDILGNITFLDNCTFSAAQ